MLTQPVVVTGRFSSLPWKIALIECELALAAGLLLGIWRRMVWLISILTFTAFAVVAVENWARGVGSCGCLGSVVISPAWMFVLNLSVVSVLVVCRPDHRHSPVGMRLLGTNRTVVVGSCISLAILLVAPVMLASASTFGTLTLTPETVYLEHLRNAATIPQTFRLTNEMNRPMRIVAIQSTCSCMNAPQDAIGHVIAPAESYLIDVTIDTGQIVGQFVANLRVLCTVEGGSWSGTLPTRAKVEGNVRSDYRILPERLDFGRVIEGARTVTRLHVTPVALEDVTVTHAHSTNRHFQVVSIRNDVDNGTWVDVECQPHGLHRRSRLSGFIEFSTTSDRTPIGRIPVEAEFNPQVEATPSALVIASDECGELQRKASIRSVSQIQIRAIEFSGIVADAVLDEDSAESGHLHVLTIRIRDADEADQQPAGNIYVTLQADPVGAGADVIRKIEIPVFRHF